MSDTSPRKLPEQQEPVAAAEDTTRAHAETPPAPDPAVAPARDMAAPEAEGAAAAGAQQAPSGATLQAQLEEAHDRQLRLQAELENVRKRMLRTVEEERRYACLPLMRDVLPVVDNLQRAIQAAEQHENATALLEGVKLVAAQLDSVLQRHHCAPIEAHGAVFDPHLHEAIAQLPSDDHEPGHVCLVTQTGYQLHDRVIRPAQVIVAAPRAAASETTAEPNDAGT